MRPSVSASAHSLAGGGPIRIVMISDHPYDDTEASFGGLLQSTAQFVAALATVDAPDIEFHLIAFSIKVSGYEKKAHNNCTLHYLPRSENAFFAAPKDLWALIRLIRELQSCEFPCIVHGNGLVKAIVASQLFARVHVHTVHGICRREQAVVPVEHRTFEQKLRFPAKEWLERRYLARIKNLIAISDEVVDEVRRAGADPVVFRIENPVDRSFFELRPRRKPATEGAVSVLFVALITPRKGLHVLLDAIEPLLGDGRIAELVVAGRWDQAPAYVDALRARCGTSPMDRVRFTGSMSTEELMDAYASADVLVLPSLAETKPMVISQAQSAGLPVIATTVGGIPEMIEDGVTGLLVPDNDEPSLRQALTRLADDVHLRASIAANSRDLADRAYDATNVVEATFAAYRQIAHRSSPASSVHSTAAQQESA